MEVCSSYLIYSCDKILFRKIENTIVMQTTVLIHVHQVPDTLKHSFSRMFAVMTKDSASTILLPMQAIQ